MSFFEELESRRLFTAGGTGLDGNYFNSRNFTGTQVSRADAQVNFNFGAKKPISNISAEYLFGPMDGTGEAGVQREVHFHESPATTACALGQSQAGDRQLGTNRAGDEQRQHRADGGEEIRHSTGVSPEERIGQREVGMVEPIDAADTRSASRLFPGDQNLKDKIDHAVAFSQVHCCKPSGHERQHEQVSRDHQRRRHLVVRRICARLGERVPGWIVVADVRAYGEQELAHQCRRR